jgi:ubiquinone/menaquinone biosynthesis C-methylase UbiE
MLRLWRALVRFGFRLLYNELAFTYDLVSRVVSLGEWPCWQRAALRFLPEMPGTRVLELAFGTGNFHADMLARGLQPVGIDLSASMGRITRSKLSRRGLPVRLLRGRVQALPFANATFPAVVSTFPTDFIVEPATLAEVRRVLIPGGRLVVVINGAFTRRSAATAALDVAYRVTGQHSVKTPMTEAYAALIAHFAESGFDARIAYEPCQRSVSVVVVADRQPEPVSNS